MTEPKVTISLRIDPDLKTHLEMEADDAGMTTSKYLEHILDNRNLEEDEDSILDELNEQIDELDRDIFRLNNTVNELTEENDQLRSEYDKQSEKLESLQQEIEGLGEKDTIHAGSGFVFSPEEYSVFQDLMKKLKKGYPELSDQQLLLACLRTTLKNEESWFFIHLVGDNV